MSMPAENLNSSLTLARSEKLVCIYCKNELGKKIILGENSYMCKCNRCGRKWLVQGGQPYGL